MSFFDLFKSGAGGASLSEHWQRLTSPEAVQELFKHRERPVLIYKHSFACSICTFSMLNLDRKLETIASKADSFFVDVRAQREISNRIAQVSGVVHQSPQAIVVYNGEVFWHGSHSEVRAEHILEALEEISQT